MVTTDEDGVIRGDRTSYHIIYLFAQKYTRNSKCQHEVAELDGQGSNGALTVAYKIKMEYNMNK